ncbi:MAG: ATP-binding cassette domain-containing protein [Clostridiales Family XIII bacterium]|jgi:energy-coupling factor transport system ATP-binding protein|nr:ATP-binding cassette domain-containing protein [Clostridiales Family XIII bacterium]
MAVIEVRDFSFTYPGCRAKVLSGISIDVERGDFVLICGKSGSGKTTLLKNLKPEIAPGGSAEGSIRLDGRAELSHAESAKLIGFVMQDPDNQIVMDSVWLELAFGMENLAVPPEEIGRRIGEIAGFFGIQSWFSKSVFELSGGQKQILNLASVIAMQADIIVLDEPTAQLDPIAAKEFLQMLKRVNSELGKTVIISEHRFEDVLSLADEVVCLEEGHIKYSGTNSGFASFLEGDTSGFSLALPAPTRLAIKYPIDAEAPLDVREGRKWLTEAMKTRRLIAATETLSSASQHTCEVPTRQPPVLLAAKDVWFKYGKADDFVLRGLTADIREGTIHAFVGGNGSGKSTLMKLLGGVLRPNKGSIRAAKGKSVRLLPQDPKSVFVCDTLADDLREHEPDATDEQIDALTERLGIAHLTDRHPYDLSSGEMQKAALAKILLLKPDVLLLDEPVKSLDAFSRASLAKILHELSEDGVTIAMVTHDVEFAAEHADRCSMVFGSAIIAEGTGRDFFGHNMFYTTSISRMTRGIIDGCILIGDITEDGDNG